MFGKKQNYELVEILCSINWDLFTLQLYKKNTQDKKKGIANSFHLKFTNVTQQM